MVTVSTRIMGEWIFYIILFDIAIINLIIQFRNTVWWRSICDRRLNFITKYFIDMRAGSANTGR
jgi:hypothetical protein